MSEEDGAKCYDFCDPCNVLCLEEGRIPDPFDCRSYYYCEPNEGTVQFTCVEGQYFDAVSKMCVDGNCENVCEAEPTGESFLGGELVEELVEDLVEELGEEEDVDRTFIKRWVDIVFES